MLKSIRKNRLINWSVRGTIKYFRRVFESLSKKWRVSGIIDLEVMGTSFKMYSKCDDGIVNQLYYGDNYVENDDLNVFLSVSRNDHVVFDIGANTGLYSLATKALNPNAKIYSFEPHPINLERLKYNIQLNDFNDIRVVNMALGDAKRKINFTIPRTNEISDTSSAIDEFSRNSYRGELDWKQMEVMQTTVDDYIRENAIEQLDLLKIDVEGYELNVLDGAIGSIEKFKPSMLVESFLDHEKRSYFSNFISKFEYEVFFIHKEGIIKGPKSITNFPGLNFLLLHGSTLKDFTSLSMLKNEMVLN